MIKVFKDQIFYIASYVYIKDIMETEKAAQ